MNEVSKEDVSRLHERIDQVVEITTEIRVHQAQMEERINNISIPEQPCQFFQKHIENHKESIRLWKRPVIGTVVDLIKMGFVLAAGYLFGKKL